MNRFLATQGPRFSVTRLTGRLLAAQALSVWALSGLASSAWAECAQPAGELASVEGIVEVKAAQGGDWVRAAARHKLCAGDTITVRAPGRAAVSLRNEVLVRLDQNSTLTLREVAPDADTQLGLTEGIAHVISRWRKRLGVVTPFINALVDGTEFTVLASPALSRVVVAEGRVRARNDKGEEVLIANQAAEVSAADAPPRSVAVRPLDAVAWAIHYPQVVWLDAAQLAALPPEVATAVQSAQRDGARGRHAQALATLQALPEAQRPPAAGAMLAASHLALGQVEAAQRLLDAPAVAPSVEGQAVRSVLLTARNDAQALGVAEAAAAAGPQSSAAALARSYALQATRQLPLALAAARQATALDAQNPVAWARRAELELSSSQLQAGRHSAQTALELDGQAHRARAMLGMAELLSGQTTQALATLDAAIAADSSDPLAHFAHGVAQIRQGRVAEGRQDVELAALLDPSNAELRGYLGRAYLEEDRGKVAGDQFELAKRLDPASPTPWFFDALRRLRDDDAIGALAASGMAQKLNQGRAVIRPDGLTTSDLSSRSVQVAQSHSLIGNDLLAQGAATRAYTEDPLDSQSLEAVARTLVASSNAEDARTKAWTQALLRQSIGQAPIPPQFLTPSLPGLEGPRLLSLQESTRLFDRRNHTAAASVLAGSRGTWGASVLGGWNSEAWQLDVSGFDFKSDRDTQGNRTQLNGARVHAQFAPDPRASVHVELLRTDRGAGEVYTPLLTEGGNSGRRDRYKTDRVLIGARGEVTPQMEWTTAVAHSTDRFGGDLAFEGGKVNEQQTTRTDSFGLNVSRTFSLGQWQLGVDHFQGNTDAVSSSEFSVEGQTFSDLSTSTATQSSTRTYGYLSLGTATGSSLLRGHVGWRSARLHLSDSEPFLDATRPKLSEPQRAIGLDWGRADTAVLRAAWFETLSTVRSSHLALEPVLFDGFVRDPDGPLAGVRGIMRAVAVDVAPNSRLPTLLEVSQHRFRFDDTLCGPVPPCDGRWQHTQIKLASTALLTSDTHVGLEWRNQLMHRVDEAQSFLSAPVRLNTRTTRLLAGTRLSPAWRVQADTEHVKQSGEAVGPAGINSDKESFWITNLRLKYQPYRRLTVSADAKNLFGRTFRYEDSAFDSPSGLVRYAPRRTFVIGAQWQL